MSLLCVLSDFVEKWLLNIGRKIQGYAFEPNYNTSEIYLQSNQFSERTRDFIEMDLGI